jgi:hypothetical protein
VVVGSTVVVGATVVVGPVVVVVGSTVGAVVVVGGVGPDDNTNTQSVSPAESVGGPPKV